MEFPISFFLDYAWNPEAWPLERLPAYPREWAAKQFGARHAAEIGELITRYTQYNARRKPELLGPDGHELVKFREFYSQVNFGEAERVVAEYNALAARARALAAKLPPEQQDAYFQLVLFPIEACANLNDLYVRVARARLHAAQGRASAGFTYVNARKLFERDAELTRQYHALGGGRWNHQMSQVHIGYDNWQQPEANRMPEANLANGVGQRGFGVAVEGDTRAWPGEGEALLPELSPYGPSRYIEVFMRLLSKIGDEFEAQSAQPWVKVSPRKGTTDTRLTVSVDWRAAPVGRHRVPITISGPGSEKVVVMADVFKPAARPTPGSFVEAGGYVAMEAAHHSRAVGSGGIHWREIPGLGRALSGVGAFPRTRVRPSSSTPSS
jgi:hypothetical protein